MPRYDATPAFVAALDQPLLRPAFLVSMTFAPYGSPPSTTVNLWTGLGTLTWNGMTFQGVGQLGQVANVEEGSTVQARGTSLTLTGIDPMLLNDALNEVRQGLPVTIWLALFDATPAIIGNPVIAFRGRMDQPTITVDGKTATIQINCESRLMDMNVPAERRYTNEDQWRDYPGDRGFEFVPSVQEVTIYWGRVPNSTNNL